MLIGTVVLCDTNVGVVIAKHEGPNVKLALNDGTQKEVAASTCSIVATPSQVLSSLESAICLQVQ